MKPEIDFTPEVWPINSCNCWDEEYWSEMTDEDWEEVYNKAYYESSGGD